MPYFLFYLLVLTGGLFQVQHACKHQQYWVKSTDSDSCKCPSASKGIGATVTGTTKDIMHRRCATLNEYATCLSNGTCKWKMLVSDKCVNLLFLPGMHKLTNDLHVSKRVSLTMVKDPDCGGNVEIYLDNASITLSSIASLTLADFSIASDPHYRSNLTLMNVPMHGCAKTVKPSYIVHVNNVKLSRMALVYKCSGCTGKMNLSNIWFDNSYAEITTTNCYDLTMYIHSWYLSLDRSHTGLAFKSLQLKSLLIDGVKTEDQTTPSKLESRPDKPVYDFLFQSKSVSQLDVSIQNCKLKRSESAGLMISVIVVKSCQFSISISNSTISNHKQGGIMIKQPSVSIGKLNFTIEDSHINYNKIGTFAHYYDHYAAGLSVHSETFNTTDVTLKYTEFKGNADGRSRPVVVYIARAYHVIVDSCKFTDNKGTAIQLNNVNDNCAPESFIFKGIVNFTGNSGYRGGALSLISAVISIKPNTTLLFENNAASDVGGAIFVDTNIPYNDETDPDTLVSCFYRFPMWRNDSRSYYSINFSNNWASNGGNNIYGAPLNCYCTVFTGESETVRSIDQSVITLFNISKNDHHSSVSSTPYRVCLTDSDDSIVSACTSLPQIFDHNVIVYPGQAFSLEAVLVGFEFGQGTGMVNAQLLDGHNSEIWPENSKFQRIEKPDKTNLSYTVYTNDTSESIVLVLTAEERDNVEKNLEEEDLRDAISEFDSTGIILPDLLTTPVHINVRLESECPPGFQLRRPPNITKCDTCRVTQPIYSGCYCLEKFDNDMECLFDKDHKNGYLCLKKHVWVELSDSAMMFSKECPLDYCKVNLSGIIISQINNNSDMSLTLCDDGREGKLCGNCSEGYSLMLGSNKCTENCSNKYLALLAFFAVAGILLVLFISALNVTVAQGTINGLIFYANVVWAYNDIFFPRYDNARFDFLKTFIAWINLDFGIEVCFFDGLDAYWKTWLQFTFPIYVWIIAGLIILLGRIDCLNRFLPKNIVHVLATLVLLSYSKLLRTVIIVLVPATIETYYSNEMDTDPRPDYVWKFDGEIQYGLFPKHCILLSVSLLALICLWIPYTFILLFINCTRSCRYIKRLIPFFEAYTGPLTPKCQFWVGLLLLVRCVLMVTLIFLQRDASVLSMVIIIVLIFVLLYNTGSIYNKPTNITGKRTGRCCQFLPESFQLSFQSMLDISFLLNLVFLGTATLYADFEEANENHIKAKAGVTNASIGIVFIQFIGIIIYPRLKEKIRDKCCCNNEVPPPEPEVIHQNRQYTRSSFDGVPPRDSEPLVKNEDANNN